MNEHFFLDGYDIDTCILANEEWMDNLLRKVNKLYFDGKGKVVLIPYFNGKIKEDGGVSGIVLGNNSHFTCHTFCYKNTIFVDYFGDINNFNNIKEKVLDVYSTDDYDLCKDKNNTDGNFGKHIIIKNGSFLSYEESKRLISRILVDIQMTPINEVITNYVDDMHFDLLQPIAESHISIHRNDNIMIIDVFSCKWFDEKKLLKLVNVNTYDKVCRGIKYITDVTIQT